MEDKVSITITTTVEVPIGDYCGGCHNLERDIIKIGWGDGLGSPGSHTIYKCIPFNSHLSYRIVDDPSTKTGGRGVIHKCQSCISAITHQASSDGVSNPSLNQTSEPPVFDEDSLDGEGLSEGHTTPSEAG